MVAGRGVLKVPTKNGAGASLAPEHLDGGQVAQTLRTLAAKLSVDSARFLLRRGAAAAKLHTTFWHAVLWLDSWPLSRAV